jgi:hypothetical protein
MAIDPDEILDRPFDPLRRGTLYNQPHSKGGT